MPIRTQVKENEALTLNIIAMVVGAPTLKYRELAGSTWTSITAPNVGRSVYSATIPAQSKDFEYYLESGSVVFPVTATSASPIYQTVVVMAAETDPCEGLPPDVPTGVTASESNCDATITWSAANCADDYRIQRSSNGGSTFTHASCLWKTEIAKTSQAH
jgi:hypothetical protein